jgi:hypothetical protein
MKQNGSEKLPSFSLRSKMKRNKSKKLPLFSLWSKMEAKFFCFDAKKWNEAKTIWKEAKTSKRKRIKWNSGTICKESKIILRLVFYFLMFIPSMVKKSEKTFISFRFKAKNVSFVSLWSETKRSKAKRSKTKNFGSKIKWKYALFISLLSEAKNSKQKEAKQ